MKAIGLSVLLVCSVANAATEPCRPIDGLQPLLRPGTVLLLGEIHGTAESPAFVLDVACHAASAEVPVVVALELPGDEQSLLDTFLSSKGTDKDRIALLEGGRWRSSYQDGRTSEAMFNLIDGARRLKARHSALKVALFDLKTSSGRAQRDRGMGRNLAKIVEANPGAMVIALTGNRHSRITKGSPRDREFEPMGYVLKQATKIERLVALNAAHGSGSAWICAPDCGISDLGGRHADAPWSIEIDDKTRPAGHDGWYRVGQPTASRPAHPARRGESKVAARPAVERTPDQATAAPQAESPTEPPTESDPGIQGKWQAYDFASDSKTWTMKFAGSAFHAEAGADDWYKGEILVYPDRDPAWIDFRIDDCRCSFKEMTSHGIYYWEDGSIVISAPRPGTSRPRSFARDSGQMMRLRHIE